MSTAQPDQPFTAAGQAMFADLHKLDAYISKWQDQDYSIRNDGMELRQASGYISAPTNDVITFEYFDALRNTLTGFVEHNRSMAEYAGAYVQSLAACRDSTSDTDQAAAARFQQPAH